MSRTLVTLAVILSMGITASRASAHHSHTIFYDLCTSGVIITARKALVSGARAVVTGLPIRPLAEIRAHFPDFTGAGVNPNSVDLISIRLVGDSYSYARPGAANPQANCDGQ